MKYIVVVPDGAADYPIEILEGKTPLEAADTPFMDSLAKSAVLGRVKTVPAGFKPASDVANLSLLGYDPNEYYTGRGPLEAANMGIALCESDLAFRCNLITESQGKLVDYSAGHITDREAKELFDDLGAKLGSENIKFFHGTSYRNLMVFRNCADLGLDKLNYCAPHDILNKGIEENFPRGENSQVLIDLMRRSKEILKDHEINKVRVDLGENPANMIWLWGCGRNPRMPLFKEKFGLKGAVVSAVDLINGIGKIIGFKVLKVEGVTGYYDTNYKGKAEAAIKALDDVDIVFVHIEATDEAGHNQDLRMKITCIERIDKLVIGTIKEAMKGKDFRMLIAPDHPTPLSLRTHTDEPVPFLICGKGVENGGFSSFCESTAAQSNIYFERGEDLMKFFLGK